MSAPLLPNSYRPAIKKYNVLSRSKLKWLKNIQICNIMDSQSRLGYGFKYRNVFVNKISQLHAVSRT